MLKKRKRKWKTNARINKTKVASKVVVNKAAVSRVAASKAANMIRPTSPARVASKAVKEDNGRAVSKIDR